MMASYMPAEGNPHTTQLLADAESHLRLRGHVKPHPSAPLELHNQFQRLVFHTALENLQNQIESKENLWTLALTSAGDGIWDWDIPSGQVIFSSRWIAKGNEAHQDIVSTYGDWLVRIHPDDKHHTLEHLQDCLSGKTGHYHNIYRLKSKKSDAYIWVLARGMVIARDNHGQPLRMMGLHSNITEKKEKEALLRENELMLSESQRIAHIGSWNWDMNNNTILWSDETYRIYGVDKEAFAATPRNFVSLIHPEDQEAIAEWRQRCETSDEPAELTFRIIRPDGKIRHINGCSNTERDSSGRLVRTLGTVQDVTERKQAELVQKHHNHILGMIADKASLKCLLHCITQDIEAINPAMICSILLLDKDGCHLHVGAAPSVPDFFREGMEGAMIGPDIGACAAAAFSGERVIIEDISNHPYWPSPYKEFALSANLRSCWSQPITSSEGQVLGTIAIYHNKPTTPTEADIHLIETEARLAALAIEKHQSDERLKLAASVFTHAREGILITDASGNIIDCNETFTQLTGYQRSEVIGQNPRFLQSGRHSRAFYDELWNTLISQGHWTGEIWNKRKDGAIFAELQTISSVLDKNGHAINYVSLFTDITLIKQHQQQLEYIAHYDALTQLPNRVLLADRLKQAIAHSHRVGSSIAVLYLDLDGFKAVNDNHGHDVGDQLLITVAQRLQEALREGDTLARIGGDEFIAILVDLEHPKEYESVLYRLLSAAADPVAVNAQLLKVSASIGVTIYPQDGAEADQLLRHADQAMYLAKQAGKNCFHLFDVAKDVAVKTQRESIEYIRHALDNREFVLFYQPKVNMRTGAVIGAEALIRWQHPERGLLPPLAFLPIIESHDISIELGDWVILDALRQMNDWLNIGLRLSVSVNVGALQLQQPDFVHKLKGHLAQYPNVSPDQLELEILETSALEDITDIAELMRECRQLGVHFAVDDFGTGYSSLTYLKRLPAELLKIDQSFVRDMLDDPDDLAIVKGVIGLAHAFHRNVIAEGVETIAHGQLLLEQDCELAQGYGIARPMPATKIPEWINSWKPDQKWTSSPT